ncbi:MAG: hypothetical protein FJX72_01870 [Armatimonadetes bacterium]|nr:hypothetical protein [Armatimonadota bacterium]
MSPESGLTGSDLLRASSLVAYVVQVERDRRAAAGDGPAEAGLDPRQVLAGQVYRILSPIGSEPDVLQLALSGVVERLVFADNPEQEADCFVALSAPRTEDQSLGAGQVSPARLISPVVLRALPDDSVPSSVRS